MKKIALLGLGRMGTGIALSILRTGHPLHVWNRNKDKAGDALNAGAIWCNTAADAAHDADFVIAMLADDPASEQVWLSANGALQTMKPGATVIECSTLSLDYVKKLSGIVQQKRLNYIDCPVTGIPTAAAKGELTLLIGGADKDIQNCKELLSSFSKTIRHFGEIGTGTCYKLMINLMGAVQIAGLAEGIALCKKLGLDLETVMQSIEGSAAASPQVLRYVRSMGEQKFSEHPSFTVALREKDAVYALRLAEETGFDAKLGTAAAQWFSSAKKQNGDRDEAIVVNEMN